MDAMSKKRGILYLLMLLMIAVMFTACSEDEDIEEDPKVNSTVQDQGSNGSDKNDQGSVQDSQKPDPASQGENKGETDDNAKNDNSDNSGQKGDNGGKDDNGAQDDLTAEFKRSISINANNNTGEYKVTRMPVRRSGKSNGTKGWTIFVYLCGTDLESRSALATGDLDEMLSATGSDKVRFIVQTGGAAEWQNSVISTNRLERYLIQNGEITLLDKVSAANMGSEKTLTDFLKWGLDGYASEHIGLIFWDHGGGSITGVCFDELNDYDSLDLNELDSSLRDSLAGSGSRFDFIGFDACLMGTIEVANILATYSDYMYASEEIEPGSGWDYETIGSFLASDPDSDALSLGKTVADSFLAACEAEDQDALTTLSIIDLSKIDAFMESLNKFAKDMYEAGEDVTARAEIVRTIGEVENFGGNNRTEGYTNMVDLGGLISACASYSSNASAARKALSNAVAYQVSGYMHEDASGLSTYYPLSVQGSEELAIFGKVCVSPYYISFVDRQSSIAVSDDYDSDYEYDYDQWFDDDGYWYWGDEDDYDDDYWDYYDDYEQTGESPFITFDIEPTLDEEDIFYFALDEWGLYNTWDVYGMVYVLSDDGEDIIEYGETYDINEDWEYGLFYDNFDGYWISLPDGQNLATYIVGYYDDCIIYTSPVYLNGEETNLRLKLTDDRMYIEGAWDGIDDWGAASRDIVKLKKGDSIVPVYHSFAIDTNDESDYYGDEYIFEGDPEVYYDLMYPGDYLYAFYIEDIYGDYYLSDFQALNLDDYGDISYYRD